MMSIEEKLKNEKPTEVLDVRGEECPIPETLAAKKLNKMTDGEILEVLTDHQPAVDVTLPYLAKRFGYPYIVIKKEDYYVVRILKLHEEEKGAVQLNDEIQVNLPFNKVVDAFLDPSILMSFVPQVKGVKQINYSAYSISMKYIIPFELPLFIKMEKYPNTVIIKYESYNKIAFLKATLGFDFFIYDHKKYTGIRVREWYEGPLKFMWKNEINKHITLAKDKLPTYLIKLISN
ncbi:hypothetical protein STK_08810 [Sulfurisphaera tokodaii str. 7]|uniref:UPF0033 domain-containing protein n=2 Tax=Sulfurisphaera tokodaii TaxID=111955 RepID=Q973L9_SULTO|nr:hypothetical protein STK_08810 [Sulfurisphaera tokodaii str. 7]